MGDRCTVRPRRTHTRVPTSSSGRPSSWSSSIARTTDTRSGTSKVSSGLPRAAAPSASAVPAHLLTTVYQATSPLLLSSMQPIRRCPSSARRRTQSRARSTTVSSTMPPQPNEPTAVGLPSETSQMLIALAFYLSVTFVCARPRLPVVSRVSQTDGQAGRRGHGSGR